MKVVPPAGSGSLGHARSDRLGRPYLAVLAAAWSQRQLLAGPSRRADELDFLPDALRLRDTPVHPLPRRVAVAIIALFAAAVTWAWLAAVDVVAVAHGRLVVSERTKQIQPLERSVVRAVLVHDGDKVTEGQVLVELDATIAQADTSVSLDQVRAQTSEQLRAEALLAWLQRGAVQTEKPPRVATGPSTTTHSDWRDADAHAANRQLHAEWNDIRGRLARLSAERHRRLAELATAGAQTDKLHAMLPLALSREADFRRLVEQGYVSGHATQDRARERIELERDLATQQARLVELQAVLDENESARQAFMADTVRNLSERTAQAGLRQQQARQENNKAIQRQQLTVLRAPVAGVVQQLAVHTVGAVVTEAQVLMVIVPDAAAVTAEVALDNKDIGFVSPGQFAEVKLETFPYTRYGTVPATVQRVTSDAVHDEKRGAVFPVMLTLQNHLFQVDGRTIRLSPGMNVTAEIKTGKRTVMEYLLSPVQKAGSESLRER